MATEQNETVERVRLRDGNVTASAKALRFDLTAEIIDCHSADL